MNEKSQALHIETSDGPDALEKGPNETSTEHVSVIDRKLERKLLLKLDLVILPLTVLLVR